MPIAGNGNLYARKRANYTISEIGGGMNFSRNQFMKLVKDIINSNYWIVIATYKDRNDGLKIKEVISNVADEPNYD